MHHEGGAFFTVVVWNLAHDRRSIFKNTADRAEAEAMRKVLREHGLDAEVITVGSANTLPT